VELRTPAQDKRQAESCSRRCSRAAVASVVWQDHH
jgi:hypothetical protein